MRPSANLEHAMAWLRAGEIATDPHMPRARQTEAFDRTARLFAAVFTGTDGEAVLQTILEATLFRSPVDCRLEGDAYLRHAQLREGQNTVAAMILAYLDHADQQRTQDDVPETIERDPDLFAGRRWEWGDGGPDDGNPGPDWSSNVAVR